MQFPGLEIRRNKGIYWKMFMVMSHIVEKHEILFNLTNFFSWNQLISNFFSKNVTFMIFCHKSVIEIFSFSTLSKFYVKSTLSTNVDLTLRWEIVGYVFKSEVVCNI